MTKEERAEYQREWYYRNIEKRQAENRAAYHRNKDKHIDQKKINNKLYYLKNKGITLQKKEVTEVKQVNKRILNINQILDILRKDNKSELWNKPIRKWNSEDWNKFNLINENSN